MCAPLFKTTAAKTAVVGIAAAAQAQLASLAAAWVAHQDEEARRWSCPGDLAGLASAAQLQASYQPAHQLSSAG